MFSSFLEEYYKLILKNKDVDTKYYVNPKTERNEIYFHYLPVNLADEFLYNYNDDEQKSINDYFGSIELYSFDIQYRDEVFLQHLLKSFKIYLLNIGDIKLVDILLSHPHKGIITV